MTPLRTATSVDYARLLLVSALWGSSFLCNAIALEDFSPVAIAGWRVTIAGLVILSVCFMRGLRIPLDKRSLLLFAAIGVLNSAVPFTLIGWGQQSVNSATAALLIASSPFATLLLSHFLTADDRFSVRRAVGLFVGFSGVFVLFAHELSLGGSNLTGLLAIVLAAMCYAVSALLIRRLSGTPSLVVVAASLTVSAMCLMPWVLWQYPVWDQTFSQNSLSALLFLAIGPTALAYVLRTQIVQVNGAVFMSNAGYLIPVFAAFWAWSFLGERPDIWVWVAMILVFSGIAIGQTRSFRQTKSA